MGRPIVMTNHLRRRRRDEARTKECAKMKREKLLDAMPAALRASLPNNGDDYTVSELREMLREAERTKLYG